MPEHEVQRFGDGIATAIGVFEGFGLEFDNMSDQAEMQLEMERGE